MDWANDSSFENNRKSAPRDEAMSNRYGACVCPKSTRRTTTTNKPVGRYGHQNTIITRSLRQKALSSLFNNIRGDRLNTIITTSEHRQPGQLCTSTDTTIRGQYFIGWTPGVQDAPAEVRRGHECFLTNQSSPTGGQLRQRQTY